MYKYSILYRSLVVCLLLAAFSGISGGQTIRASIYGTVLDASSAPVPDATVRAIHVPTNTETTFVTDRSGA